jgi:phage-related protein
MAYNNPFLYNRDQSISNQYNYIEDLSIYKPVYSSSVNFSSRLNFLKTTDNSLKILPASENNLRIEFNLKFLLNEEMTGNLLKTIEIAGAFKVLKFYDPSSIYKQMMGVVEDYSVSRSSNKLNEVDIKVSNYFSAPMLYWKTSPLLDVGNFTSIYWSQSKSYKKYSFAYFDVTNAPAAYNYTDNKINNFWFAKTDIPENTPFSTNNWTRDFLYEIKLPFQLQNKLDYEQVDYKNSFIQNLKNKENSNSIKEFSVKIENINDFECKSILFFLEKKCGYRRFIYQYPIFFNKNKVFICVKWSHVFKYKNCNTIDATFVEDSNPNIFIDENNYYHLL